MDYEIITDDPLLSDSRRTFPGLMLSRYDAVRRWLSRSGTCPLLLSVTYSGQYSGIQNSKDDGLIHEILRSAPVMIICRSLERGRFISAQLKGNLRQTANIQSTHVSLLQSQLVSKNSMFKLLTPHISNCWLPQV